MVMTRQLPITFCPEMLKAAYEGRKRMTRRLIPGILPTYTLAKKPEFYGPEEYAFVDMADPIGSYPIYAKPSYRVGDECWVRETWGVFDVDADEDVAIAYKADPDDEFVKWFSNKAHLLKGKYRLNEWRSSRFMFKDFARHWLRITKVHDPQRVNAISPSDCEEEGIIGKTLPSPIRGQPYEEYRNGDGLVYTTPKDAFQSLWDSLHTKPGEQFEDGCWVFRYEFEMIERQGCTDRKAIR